MRIVPLFSALLLLAAPATGAAAAPVTVVVKLGVEPAATYRGTLPKLAATSPTATGRSRFDPGSRAVRAYRAHLAGVLDGFEATLGQRIPAARVLYRYDVVIGGVAVQLPEDAIDALRALPGVRSVTRDAPMPFTTDKSPAFVGAPKVWSKLDGAANAGEGVIIGLLDSGIWPEHPSFADPDPKGKPYVAPPGSRACQFDVGANPGPPFACNGKLIGAYRFMAAYDACGVIDCPAGRFTSVRDGDGHGSGVAGIAAGNAGVAAAIGGIKRGVLSGVAPRAHLVMYKTGERFHFGTDIVAAVQQAILDGVDVLNFSIRGHPSPYVDIVSLAFRDAVAAGIFVAAGAGNDGPGPSTITQVAPWATSVGATTPPRDFRSKVTLKASDGAKLKTQGFAITGAIKSAPYVAAASVGDPTCLDATADGTFAGAVVACRNGIVAEEAARNVAARGAIGMLIFEEVLPLDGRSVSSAIPLVAVDFRAAAPLAAFLASHPAGTASVGAGKAAKLKAERAWALSSRGGPALTLGIAKPDVGAPGMEIIAAMTPEPSGTRVLAGQLFNVWQGTSFATPFVAGAAALFRQQHPTWTPGEIQSALMTTASTKKLFSSDGVTPATPFDVGSGRLLLKPAMDPGITFAAPVQDFFDHAADLWTVNYPSLYVPGPAPANVSVERTATSTLAKDSLWSLTVASPPDLLVTVPPTLTVSAGGSATFPITVDKSALGPGVVRHATLTLAYKKYRAVLPITAVGDVPLPDLVVTTASVSSPLVPGHPMNVGITAANVGTASAGRFFAVLFLSTDATLDAQDSFFAFCEYPGLDAGGSFACNFTATFTASVAPGTYRVLAVADSSSLILERNEVNNALVLPGTVTVQ